MTERAHHLSDREQNITEREMHQSDQKEAGFCPSLFLKIFLKIYSPYVTFSVSTPTNPLNC